MMRGDLLVAEALGELARHPLGHAARVDEDQRGAMRFDELRQPVIDLLPDIGGHDRFERCGRHLDGEVARAAVAGVDDAAVRAGRALAPGADEKARDVLDRLLRRRQAHPQQAVAALRIESLQRQRQMGAALVRGDGVDLVDDDGPRRLQHFAAGLGAEQDVERFGRGDEDVRRPAAHAVALARRRVAGAHPGADVDIGKALRAQGVADAGERRLQVLLDVVGERLQRRDIDDLRLVGEPAGETLPHQPVDRREKGGERLAGARGRGDQHMPAVLDGRPGLGLRRGGCGEAATEPGGDRRVKQGFEAHGEQDGNIRRQVKRDGCAPAG